jgi:catechol 2,3-dioxygenase-like lactoylglutathione lyase family enzyme
MSSVIDTQETVTGWEGLDRTAATRGADRPNHIGGRSYPSTEGSLAATSAYGPADSVGARRYLPGMTPIANLSVVALDCADPAELARFYSEITGWPVAESKYGDWFELRSDGPVTIACQLAPGHRPPIWPSDQHPQQVHLDFAVPDLDEGERRVLAVGARKAETQPSEHFRVYLDPAGHPFCLVLDP